MRDNLWALQNLLALYNKNGWLLEIKGGSIFSMRDNLLKIA